MGFALTWLACVPGRRDAIGDLGLVGADHPLHARGQTPITSLARRRLVGLRLRTLLEQGGAASLSHCLIGGHHLAVTNLHF
jgi:hypothetical protein